MIRKLLIAGAMLSLAVLACHSSAWAMPQDSKPGYTLPEYNAYNAAVNEKDPAQRVKLLDDFVSKYPESTLMEHAYRTYFLTHYELKNFPKTIEYADKLLSLGEKIEIGKRLEALNARSYAFFYGANQKALQTPEQLNKTKDASALGLKLLGQWTKGEGITEEQYAAEKKRLSTLFNSIGGIAALQVKDYPAAVGFFKSSLELDPMDAATHYRLGLAYLQNGPERAMDGFWSLARAIALKIPIEAQVRNYLKAQINRYQQPACDTELDKQMSEIVALAASSPERPANYKIYSAAEIEEERKNAGMFLERLQAGGDAAKLTWLSVCGLEFPDVAVKVIEVGEGENSVVLKVFRASKPEDLEAGTTANLEVKIVDQPEARRVAKDSFVRVTATLSGFQPEPFMLFWDKGKVNAEDIPEAKAEPAKKTPAKKTPAKTTKAPAKKVPPKSPGR